MSGKNANLDGGRFLADLYSKDSIQASFLQKIINAINKLGNAAGVSPVGEAAPPPPVNSINVAASGELLHISLNHSAAASTITRPVHYFVEIATDPNFTNPIVHHLGASRTPPPITLPTSNSSGTKYNYYVRAYSQYPGSRPSKPAVFGGSLNPASITMTGTTQLDLLSSTGSGTASPTGQQGGQGFGKFHTQQPVPKQSAASIPPTSTQQNTTAAANEGSTNNVFPLFSASVNSLAVGWNAIGSELINIPSGTHTITFTINFSGTSVLAAGTIPSNVGVSISSGTPPSTPQASVAIPGTGPATVTLSSPLIGTGLTLTLYCEGVSSGTVNLTYLLESVQSITVT